MNLKTRLLDFPLNKINNDDQFLVERLLEIVPKHVDARNRKFSKNWLMR